MRQRRVALWGVIAAGIAGVGWLGYRAYAARAVTRETLRLAEVLQLTPSSRIADVGAGAGAFTIELARRVVPEGHVFATEIERDGVEQLRERMRAAGLSHVSVLQARPDHSGLPEGCCDAVFLRGVYHHIAEPESTVRSLHAALRPGGRLAIIDFEPSWFLSTFFPVEGVPADRGGHGIDPSIVIGELEAAGFALAAREDDWTRAHYCLIFERH